MANTITKFVLNGDIREEVASKIFHVNFQALQHSYLYSSQSKFYVFAVCKL